MQENFKEELHATHEEYSELVEFVKTQEFDDSLEINDRIKLFADFHNQKELNVATKNLFWATIFLFATGALQLMNELQGKEATRIFINDATRFIIWFVLIGAGIKLLGSIWYYLKKIGRWVKNKIKK